MKPITLDEIKNVYEYEKVRPQMREAIIQEKRHRRVQVGPQMTFVFENRRTILFQIQEMIRTERIITDDGMQAEIDTYNQLLPGDNELSATLLIEITVKHDIRPVLDSLVGLTKDSVFLTIGEREIPASFDEMQSEDDRISAVQYVKWKLTDPDIERMRLGASEVAIVVRHPNYSHYTVLTAEQRDAIINDISVSVTNKD
jgi:hypothetical protein